MVFVMLVQTTMIDYTISVQSANFLFSRYGVHLMPIIIEEQSQKRYTDMAVF